MTETNRNEHLIYAILSMDAYHRSSGGGLAAYFGTGLTEIIDQYTHKTPSPRDQQRAYGFSAEA